MAPRTRQREFLPTRHGFDYFQGHTGGCIDYYQFRYGNLPDWYEGEEKISRDGYATDLIADEAVRWIQSHQENPFFLYVPFNAPHYAKAGMRKKEFLNILQAPQEVVNEFHWIEDPCAGNLPRWSKSWTTASGASSMP